VLRKPRHSGISEGYIWRSRWRIEVDEILWSLSWSAALIPALSMIPSSNVFLSAPTGLSLTATVKDGPDSLCTFTDTFFAHLLEFQRQDNMFCSSEEDGMEQPGQDQVDAANTSVGTNVARASL
jgi:hypothetical protein